MINIIWRRAALFVALAMAPPLSLAEDCVLYKDVNDALAIGSVALGSKVDRLPSGLKKSANCLEDRAKNYYDCEYIDRHGVAYLVEGDRLIRSEVRDLASVRGAFIGGIVFGDSFLDVLRKFRSLPTGFPNWVASSESPGKGFILGTGTCLQASNGTAWSYYLKFSEDGRLASVGSRVLWN